MCPGRISPRVFHSPRRLSTWLLEHISSATDEGAKFGDRDVFFRFSAHAGRRLSFRLIQHGDAEVMSLRRHPKAAITHQPGRGARIRHNAMKALLRQRK